MSKVLFTEEKLHKMVNECLNEVLIEMGFKLLNESEGNNLIMNVMEEYSVFDLLSEFIDDKKHGETKKEWDLIPAQQYTTLLQRFMSAPTPDAARIPENVVDAWFEVVVKNTVILDYMTCLAGHASYFPSDDLEDMFGDEVDWSDYHEASKYLYDIGFYDWCKLPDNSNAWSDYGLQPIYKLISSYQENMEPYEVLILINKILDITHHRGDLASAFIEGGSRTCSQVSGIENVSTINENTNNEGVGKFLGSAYQWLRNKYYNFKNDFRAGRNYQRYKNMDYDPYSNYGDDADKFRNLGGQEYANYRYNLAKDRNQNAETQWKNQFGNTTDSWIKPSDNPDLNSNEVQKQPEKAKKTTKQVKTEKPKQPKVKKANPKKQESVKIHDMNLDNDEYDDMKE